MKSTILAWLEEGNITIPSMLLSEYRNLNLNEIELVLLLNILAFIEKGNEFPTPEELSARMTVSVLECNEMLRRLIQRGFIEIMDQYSNEGIRFEKYTVKPLWEKLIDLFMINNKTAKAIDKKTDETDLYTCFENEFGRPLSPFECESLGMWMDDDHHDPIIIKAALRESVMSGKLNFRYIDRILFEWKKNGIKTIEQAKNHGRKFRQKQSPKGNFKDDAHQPTVPFYNWLEQ
ncbi:DnaD domain-containing protein [Neobacillus sp. MM2021_6]|uniref:DnaD domain-containing protein n=1 Tax=Bacillaceae TaxID=186817 RepID=UPI00140D9C3B|nr:MULTISPECIES: DnaD domain-containing protein [Bacillaceae]MBO0958186.1 DnaD domain-containing protein [Neobacillus sp. MM2021_6]NHC18522.1 DnaD domain-containing protein [Bacillus sp. MM2020_4]WML40341.1 DnaD domain-containing protein [Neobacillus sp. OS1-2]